jgi:hypothetical protein
MSLSTAARLLTRADPPPLPEFGWLRLLRATAMPELDELIQAQPADVRLRLVEGARARNREDSLAEWGRALRFPDYYGHNYPALIDCLRDQLWRGEQDEHGVLQPAPPLVVIVDHPAALLADAPPGELDALLSSIDNPISQPRTAGLAATTSDLHVLLRVSPANQRDLLDRLAAVARTG